LFEHLILRFDDAVFADQVLGAESSARLQLVKHYHASRPANRWRPGRPMKEAIPTRQDPG